MYDNLGEDRIILHGVGGEDGHIQKPTRIFSMMQTVAYIA